MRTSPADWLPLGARLFQRRWFRYLFGLATAGIAFGLRTLFAPWTGRGAPFVLFFGATLTTSLLAGVGPGLMVLLISVPISAIAFSIPAGTPSSEALIQASLYAFDGLIVVYLTYLAQRARRRLADSEARAREVIELSPDAYFQPGRDGRFVYVNDAACKLLGYTREELSGKTMLDLAHPRDRPRLYAVRADLREGRPVHTGEWTMVRKDGTPVPVEASSSLLPEGRVQAFVRDISDRKHAEAERHATTERLRESEEYFRLIFEEAPIGVAVVALDGRFVRVNRALCELLDYTPEELERLSFQDITVPEDIERSVQLQKRILGGDDGVTYQLEKQYIRKGGDPVAVRINVSVVRDSEGHPSHHIAHIEDIAERTRAEAALRHSELKFRRLVESMPDGVFIYQAGGIIYSNHSFGVLLGYDDETALLGRPISELVTPASLELVRQHIRRTGEIGRIVPPQQVMLVRRDGSLAAVESVGIGVQLDGAPAFVVVVRDLAERVRREREQRILAEVGIALAETLDYERTLAAVAQIAVGDFADWCVVEVLESPSGIRRLKVACADPAKAAIADQFERIQLDRGRPYLTKRVVDSRQPLLISRLGPKQLDGAAQNAEHREALRALDPVSLLSVPLLLRDELLGTVTFISSTPSRLYERDDLRLAKALAERASLAIENARLYRAAVQATRLRDQVLGVVAHDLRNPLHAVSLHASALQRRDGRPERRNQRHREAIERATRRMNRLIQDLLDVAVLEAGRLKVERVTVSSDDLVQEAVDMEQPLAAAAALDLRVDLDPRVPDVLGDRDRLMQVFENLIGNALKFTQPGGRITVGAARGEPGALFWVGDTGSGMTREQLARVFEPFWQASGRAGHLGAGLGLPITKGIIEAHGGHIWAESTPRVGTTFYFWLPGAPPVTVGVETMSAP
jgi:PAS domain S-box-containing protein